MKLMYFGRASVLVLTFLFLFAQATSSQIADRAELSKLDQAIQAGFDSLKAGQWNEAVMRFEAAQKVFEKEKQPSEFLFTLFTLPDEDNSAPPSSPEEKQITNYRHSVATKQALLQFLASAQQLNGNSAQAQKYDDAVYALQGPLWGLSWRIFAPRFHKVFDDYAKPGKGENFGRYQYLNAVLLISAGDELEKIFSLLQNAQQNLPKDAGIAAHLANAFLQKKNPKEGKRQAELSLSVKPDQKSVLIDLATAEWLLSDLDSSIKHAEAAVKLDTEAPGPRVTLALNYIEKNDLPRALKEAAAAVDLSRRHPFYLTVQAAAFEAAGNAKEAEKLLREAWKQRLPSYEDLDKWYINEKLRNLVLKIVRRLDTVNAET